MLPWCAWQAEGVASRIKVELVRVNSEAASLKERLAEVPRREEALKRQLAARTEQLEALQRGLQTPAASGLLTSSTSSNSSRSHVGVHYARPSADSEAERTVWSRFRELNQCDFPLYEHANAILSRYAP